MKNTDIIKGYKVTDGNYTCRNMKYEIGKWYEHKGSIEMCNSGFHFCRRAVDCFNYKEFNPENKVFEIEAKEVIDGEDKSVCRYICLVRELTWEEVLSVVNSGIGNTGFRNTGYSNVGYRNTGDRNVGNRNTGDWNTGDRNVGNRNTGAFCNVDAPFLLFNKPSEWTENDFLESDAYKLMCNNVDTKKWIPESHMTEEEKKAHPSYKTAEGYLKDIPFKEAFQNAWGNWNKENRSAFTSLPNFDWEIFTFITGVEKP